RTQPDLRIGAMLQLEVVPLLERPPLSGESRRPLAVLANSRGDAVERTLLPLSGASLFYLLLEPLLRLRRPHVVPRQEPPPCGLPTAALAKTVSHHTRPRGRCPARRRLRTLPLETVVPAWFPPVGQRPFTRGNPEGRLSEGRGRARPLTTWPSRYPP